VRFYEKVVTVKADVAALLTFLVLCGFRHISTEKFALGRSGATTGNSVDPQHPPLCLFFRVFSPPHASSVPCCMDPVVTCGAVKGAPKGRSS
jgi:hypothetical protein